MVLRRARARLRSLLRRYPAVALVGPRQVGKTTLARTLGSVYFDLEQEADRLRLDLEWDRLVDGRGLAVLDEAQSHPALFPRLRGAIDARRRRNGRFLLLGSVSPGLMREVSESLAGRLALYELTPFLLSELPRHRVDDRWLRGGYPDGLLKPSQFPHWHRNYLDLLAQRDLPSWGLPAKPQVTLRLLRMLAAAHGAVWNASEIGRSLGLTYHTVNGYLDYLEGAFLIRRLPPFSGNLRKRLVRSPKVYWRDSGLLHALLGVQSAEELLYRPWVGASWEGFVIEQLRNELASRGPPWDVCFLRTSDGSEIDLVLERAGRRVAVEVKLTASPGHSDVERLRQAAAMIRADRCVLACRVSRPVGDDRVVITNVRDAARWIA